MYLYIHKYINIYKYIYIYIYTDEARLYQLSSHLYARDESRSVLVEEGKRGAQRVTRERTDGGVAADTSEPLPAQSRRKVRLTP